MLHGDFWPGNTLWREGRLQALINWEDAAWGDPLADVANGRCEIAMLWGQEAAAAFTQRYRLRMPGLDYGSLGCWDLLAALRPMGRLAGWGLAASVRERLRAGHRTFVDNVVTELGLSLT